MPEIERGKYTDAEAVAAVLPVSSTDVEVSELGAATYDDVQDYVNFFGDRTLISGGGITDNGNGTATVAAGTAWAKATDSDTAIGTFFDFSADNSVALTDLITNYVYLDYNAGTPQIVVSTSITTHGFKQDHIHIATIFRNGTTLHYHEEDAIGIGRINIADMRFLEMHDADRASGLVTTDATSLALNVSAGVIYEGLNRHTTAAQIPASWSTWHYDGDLGTPAWVEVTGQSTIDNANYNNVATGLASLTSNRYAVHWLYVDIDGANLFIIYGQGDYTINQAEEAGVPASLPDIAVHYGVLIAKIIVQEGQTALEILYPWTTTFHSSKATDHGNLAGLGDDDHAQYLLADGTRTLTDNLAVTAGKTIDGVDVSAKVISATTAAEGLSELAIASEINTGTDATRANTPDSLAGSNFGIRYLQAVCFDFTTDVATGNGKMYWHIPPALNGMNLVYCHAEVITAGTTGTLDIQIHELVGAVDMLSTVLTVDSAETGSDTAATPYVINAANDDVATNDVIRVDVDVIHTTPCKGLIISLGFQLP